MSNQIGHSEFMTQTWRFSDRFMAIQGASLKQLYSISSFFYNNGSKFLKIAPVLYILYLMITQSGGYTTEVLLVAGLWILCWVLEYLLDRFFVHQVYEYNPFGIIRSTAVGAIIMLLLSVLFLIVIF